MLKSFGLNLGKSLIWLFITVYLAIAAPFPASSQNDDTSNNAPIATGDGAPTDQQIRQRIKDIFGEIDGLGSIFVTVNSGVVTLRGRVTDTELGEHAARLASRVEGVVEVSNSVETVTEVTKRIVPVLERLHNRTLQAINYIPLLLVALTVFAIVTAAGWWLAARKFPWSKIAPNSFIADLLRQIVRLAFLACGILIALDILGSTALLGTILGAAGIVGLAIGFAVRDTVENYIASILLSIRQPFRPMDYVDIEGTEGSVLGLTSRATILMDANGNHIRIPNSAVFKATILNYDRNPQRRFTFLIKVADNGRMDEALSTGLDAIKALDFVLETPAPNDWIDDSDGSTVTLWFSGWVDQGSTSYPKARSEALRQVRIALEKAGFESPVQSRRVIMENENASAQKSTKTKRPASSGEVADTSIDTNDERALKEERARIAKNDLLNDSAPQEIN